VALIPYHVRRMSQLANQVAVVTGAGRGIGRAIALKFAAAGADVVCVSRTAENSEKVANEVRALGRKAWAVAVDVSDTVAVMAAAEKILAEVGKVDTLVNNAGITRDNLLMRMGEADWDTESEGRLFVHQGVLPVVHQTAFRAHYQRCLRDRVDWQCRPMQLCRQ